MELRPHLMLEATVLAMRVARRARGLHLPPRGVRDRSRATASKRIDEFRAAGPARRALARARRRRRRVHRRRGDGDARVDGGPARDAAAQAAVPEPGRLPRAADAHPERRDARAHPGDPPERRRVVGRRSGRASATGTRLWSVTGAVGKPGCYEAPNGVTTRELVEEHAGGFTDEVGAVVPGRRRERDPAAGRARRAAHARRPARVRRRPGLGRRAGLPGVVLPAPPARRDDALLRRGVVPEVHAVPDRQPRAPPPRRGARARARGDDAREGRRVAARDGEDVDLRPRPGVAVPRAERDDALARAVRAARHGTDDADLGRGDESPNAERGALPPGRRGDRTSTRRERRISSSGTTPPDTPSWSCGSACCASCWETSETT